MVKVICGTIDTNKEPLFLRVYANNLHQANQKYIRKVFFYFFLMQMIEKTLRECLALAKIMRMLLLNVLWTF